MRKVLYLDPRSYKIDLKASPFWSPEKYGVKIDLHPDAFNIPKQGISKDYTAIICSEVWELPIRKTLQYLRNKGLPIYLLPREPIKSEVLKGAMFSYEKFKHDGEYYFRPDLILSPGKKYSDLWGNKASSKIVGYPRFDVYLKPALLGPKDNLKKYKIDINKPLIFFPDFPPYYLNESNIMIDLYDEREMMLVALEEYAKRSNSQIVVKIHPASMKPFLKNTGNKKEVSGILLERYKQPTSNMVVVGDDRGSGLIAKQLIFHSDMVVGFASTMLLEAEILKKPAINMLLGKCRNMRGLPEFDKYLPTAYDVLELHKLLDAAKYVKNPMLEEYLYQVDGRCCERICEAIK